MITAAARRIAAPIDPSSLAAFRILFGLLMAFSMLRFIARGWVDEFYVQPTFHFTWELFPWVWPLPPALMHLHFVMLAVLGLAIALGLHYRLSAALFFIGFSYVELIDKATYLNHYYLVSLLSGLLAIVPAHRVWSVDAWRNGWTPAAAVPAWTVNVLRFQIGVAYLFAGLAKLNADWLLDAQPLRIWLAARSDLPIVGPFLAEPAAAYVFSWCGAAYDLAIVFLLLSRRTRAIAYATVVVFHVMTAVLFPIGMFPWIMIVATLVFFPPDWPRRWIGRPAPATLPAFAGSRVPPAATVAMLVLYAAVQIVLPLRAYWPGTDPDWTCRGFNFAWRVMLVEKAGFTEFIARDTATGREWVVPAREYVTERQEKMMAQDPFMVRALARHIAADLRGRGFAGIEVRADAFATINGHPAQRLIDPQVDLAATVPPGWIVSRRAPGEPI